MEDYAESIKEIEEIRDNDKLEALTKIENKVYWMYVRKISWLAENCRPDLAITVLKILRKSKDPKLEDLRYVNKVVKKIMMQNNKMKFTTIGERDDLEIMV